MEPPVGMLTIKDMLATFGAFMAVLIANEIFVNIVIYLREDVIHEQLVVAASPIVPPVPVTISVGSDSVEGEQSPVESASPSTS